MSRGRMARFSPSPEQNEANIAAALKEQQQREAEAAEAKKLAVGKQFRRIYMAFPGALSNEEQMLIIAGANAGKADEVITQEIMDARAEPPR